MDRRVTLEDRIAALESTVERILSGRAAEARRKDWRQTIGRFAGDELMKEIDLEGAKFRNANRKIGGK